MPKSTGYISHTPLQSWSYACEEHRQSMLDAVIEHTLMKLYDYILIENVVGLQKSDSLKTTLDSLKGAGYTITVLDISDKTIIVGSK